MIRAFQERFPLDRLARLRGVELLIELHGRGKDSLAYWLERKNDEVFNERFFGGIKGGSALKFVVYQSAEDDRWYTGSSNNVHEIPAAEAGAVAERQRDQLLAVVALVRALPADPEAEAWKELQSRVEAVAPEFHQLAFFHKAVGLYSEDRLDDYHALPHQTQALVGCGLDASQAGLWANAHRFLSLRSVVGVDPALLPMSNLMSAMYKLSGPPVGTWRVGTSHEEYDAWPEMRERGLTAIGWTELGDLRDVVGQRTGHDGVAAVKDAVRRQYPHMIPTQVGKAGNQLWNFLHNMAAGDRVVAAKGQRIVGVGEVLGDYYFDAAAPFGHRRPVRWLPLTEFKTTYTDGLQTTLHRLDGAVGLRAELTRRLADGVPAELAPAAPLSTTVRAILDQLERKGQVILHGPPGTGKTFHALQAAEELVARATHGRSWSELAPLQRDTLKSPGDGQRLWVCTFHPAYGYEDFVEGLFPRPVAGGLAFEPREGLLRLVSDAAAAHPDQLYVIVIDEFNRGDAPRIFGELLTLLELDKRECLHVVLPHSRLPFTVRRNVRLIATMNTSDRSIALLDAALRRRFGFLEILPDSAPLEGGHVAGVSLPGLLAALNRNLLRVLGDRARDLQVGHSYLMRGQRPLVSPAELRDALRHDVLPLLQEYAAEDPRALLDLVGADLYDLDARRFRDNLLTAGREDELAEALHKWGPEVRAQVEPPAEDAGEEDA